MNRAHGYGRAETIVSLMITIEDAILGALPHETIFNRIERNLRPKVTMGPQNGFDTKRLVLTLENYDMYWLMAGFCRLPFRILCFNAKQCNDRWRRNLQIR